MLKVPDRAKLLASQRPGSGDTEEPVLDLRSFRAAVSQGHKPLGDHSAPCPARKSSWTNPVLTRAKYFSVLAAAGRWDNT